MTNPTAAIVAARYAINRAVVDATETLHRELVLPAPTPENPAEKYPGVRVYRPTTNLAGYHVFGRNEGGEFWFDGNNAPVSPCGSEKCRRDEDPKDILLPPAERDRWLDAHPLPAQQKPVDPHPFPQPKPFAARDAEWAKRLTSNWPGKTWTGPISATPMIPGNWEREADAPPADSISGPSVPPPTPAADMPISKDELQFAVESVRALVTPPQPAVADMVPGTTFEFEGETRTVVVGPCHLRHVFSVRTGEYRGNLRCYATNEIRNVRPPEPKGDTPDPFKINDEFVTKLRDEAADLRAKLAQAAKEHEQKANDWLDVYTSANNRANGMATTIAKLMAEVANADTLLRTATARITELQTTPGARVIEMARCFANLSRVTELSTEDFGELYPLPDDPEHLRLIAANDALNRELKATKEQLADAKKQPGARVRELATPPQIAVKDMPEVPFKSDITTDFRVGDKVLVYDRYRHALVIHGIITVVGSHDSGCEVEFTTFHPMNKDVGKRAWFFAEQLRHIRNVVLPKPDESANQQIAEKEKLFVAERGQWEYLVGLARAERDSEHASLEKSQNLRRELSSEISKSTDCIVDLRKQIADLKQTPGARVRELAKLALNPTKG